MEGDKVICGCSGEVKTEGLLSIGMGAGLFTAKCEKCKTRTFGYPSREEALAAFRLATRADVIELLREALPFIGWTSAPNELLARINERLQQEDQHGAE